MLQLAFARHISARLGESVLTLCEVLRVLRLSKELSEVIGLSLPNMDAYDAFA
jgi:hypothetical protein